ncbi:MAG: cupin domain-containing protein [Vicinamibacterales bacterium]
MAFTRVPLAALPWTQGGHPLERKKGGAHPSLALLEFQPGFADPNWCRRGHIIYVISGVLTFELETGLVQVTEGESCVIDAGTPHRAQNHGDEAVVAFVASEVTV